MLGFFFRWLAMQMLRPMLVARCLGIVPDGGTMLDDVPDGWRKAWVSHQWLV
jgi:hypothetical protein